MKNLLDDAEKINSFTPDLHGVFTLPDLKNLFSEPRDNLFYRRLKALEKAGRIQRVVRGIYTSPVFDMQNLSQKVIPDSYLSLGTVLAESLMIGSIPENETMAVRIGKKRVFITGYGTLVYLGIAPALYFGFKKKDGINKADKEKAFLDTLYYFQKGLRFAFDIYSDIDVSVLHLPTIDAYLKHYRNPKFKSFVRNYLHDHDAP
jgi:hypothetical protein